MIQSYREEPFALSSNSSVIALTTDCIRTRSAQNCCNWLNHNDGSPLYKILTGGYYEINFNANISSATAGTVAIQILVDGVPVSAGATAIQEVATAGDYYNISIHKIIPVCCRGDATITIASVPSVLTGATTPAPTDTEIPLLQNVNLTIKKLS